MKPNPSLQPQRALAQHCTELLRPTGPERDLAQCAADFCDAVAAALRDPLASLLGGARLTLTHVASETVESRVITARYKGPAAHYLIGGLVARGGLAISIEREAALALCDRAFGGTGRNLPPLGDGSAFPPSIDLMLEDFGTILTEALAASDGAAGNARIAMRGTDLARLVPYGCNAECLSLELQVQEEDREPWSIRFTGLSAGFSRTLQDFGTARPAPSRNAPPSPEAFGDIPLKLQAVMAEISLPAARVATLAPGDCLPLAMRGDTALRVGNRVIGTGQVGTLDNMYAVKLNRLQTSRGSVS